MRISGNHSHGFRTSCLALCISIQLCSSATARPQEDNVSPRGLQSLLSPGLLLQDRNKDGVIDFIDARIVVGESAEAADVAAAANIAARLGYETMALELPLPSESEARTHTIFVGAEALTSAGLPMKPSALATLRPGEGIVHWMSGGLGNRWIVTGADAKGTAAAAAVFAGRLPYLWDPDEASLETVVQDLGTFLQSEGVQAEAVNVTSVHVRSGEKALSSIVLLAELRSTDDMEHARLALEKLASARISSLSAESATTLLYVGTSELRILLSAPGAATLETALMQQASLPEGPTPRRPGSGAKPELTLSNLYTPDGMLGDSDGDWIPDRVDVLLSPHGKGTQGTIDFAARIGLESAGTVIPIAQTARAIAEPSAEPTLVLIGREHPFAKELIENNKWKSPSLDPGQGWVEIVPKAFGEKSAVVVTGGDDSGVSAALTQLAERFPHVWERGKDRTTLSDIEFDLERFLSGRSPSGQAATALYKLESLAEELSNQALEWAHVQVYVEKAPPGLTNFVLHRAEEIIQTRSLEVTVENLDVQNANVLVDEKIEIPSEVDDFWHLFHTRVLPKVRKGRPAMVRTLLSEPPEIRAKIRREALEALVQAGASQTGTKVTVLSAFKQGYSWLYDEIRPELEDQPFDKLTVRVAENGPPVEWPHQAMYAPHRWMMELFPIDEVLAQKLDVPLDRFQFEKAPRDATIYEAIATRANGEEIFHKTFEPKYVLRPYFDVFPDYEKVRVTTGWIVAEVDGRTILDHRIITDPERFWDYFQSSTLRTIYDYVMDLSDGQPRADDAPHFGELRVDLSLSEPDYMVGVDQEQISTLESVHEEIYFGVLHFFDVLGKFSGGSDLKYPGRVLPYMRPKSDGSTGQAHITLTGFGSPRPAVVIDYRLADGTEGSLRRDIPRVELSTPQTIAASIRAGQDGIEQLELRVKVDSEADERAALIQRADEREVDRRILSAKQVTDTLHNLGQLQESGLYPEALTYHNLQELAVVVGWDYEPQHDVDVVTTVDTQGSPARRPDIRTLLPPEYKYDGESLVQWEHPIPPGEAYEILAKMSTFDEASVYFLGHSYLGKEIWAMDLMPPMEATHWSQAKATTLKPTIMFSAREHANEISSTSHVLKLAELILTKPEFREKLNKVNVVIHPITNPDGAQFAYDLSQITPDFMLHAGYLGALGVGVQDAHWDKDPIYPESRHRPLLWRTWLPDIFLSPHGYPKHEWIQMFSEYAAWVRNRGPGMSRSWWGMRGWYTNIRYIEDPKYPRHKDAAFQIRSKIIDFINAVPEVQSLNERSYDRYHRWAVRWDPDHFKLDITNGVLAYTQIKGSKGGAEGGNDFMHRNPRITIYRGGTEAPDETAHGDWLKLVATAGLQFDKANLQYLVDGKHVVERKVDPFYGGFYLHMHRPRPPKIGPMEKDIENP